MFPRCEHVRCIESRLYAIGLNRTDLDTVDVEDEADGCQAKSLGAAQNE